MCVLVWTYSVQILSIPNSIDWQSSFDCCKYTICNTSIQEKNITFSFHVVTFVISNIYFKFLSNYAYYYNILIRFYNGSTNFLQLLYSKCTYTFIFFLAKMQVFIRILTFTVVIFRHINNILYNSYRLILYIFNNIDKKLSYLIISL